MAKKQTPGRKDNCPMCKRLLVGCPMDCLTERNAFICASCGKPGGHKPDCIHYVTKNGKA